MPGSSPGMTAVNVARRATPQKSVVARYSRPKDGCERCAFLFRHTFAIAPLTCSRSCVAFLTWFELT
jgi:hypothetical protein